MPLSGFRVVPRTGHLERAKQVCSYLYKMKHGFIRVRTEDPDYSDLPHSVYNWERTVHKGAKEEIPSDAPESKGKRVVLTTYKDVNLCHNMMTGKAVTGILHLIYQTPVDWFAKKKSTVKTATYCSEFAGQRSNRSQPCV